MTALISFLSGAVMPLLVEVIKTKLATNNRLVAYGVSLVTSIALGSLAVFADGTFDSTQLLGSIGLCFTTAQTSYNTWFKMLDLDKKIEARLK